MKAVEIKKDIYWVGALDPNLRVFDIIMTTPYGTTYNSYVVKGTEKTAIFETVKEGFFNEFLERLNSANINIKNIDYIIIDHTEPDHSGSIEKLLNLNRSMEKLLNLIPNIKIVGSPAAIKFMRAISNKKFESIIVKDGDTLSLGNKTLQFISAPFLHWPDSMYTYILEDNILMTCDSFGAHYCNTKIFNDLNEDKEGYMDALKYYFDGIMGPFKSYVLEAIDKIKDLKIDIICPGHGPILREDPLKIINLYKEWSTNKRLNTKKHIVISYVSAYGYTESITNKIIEGIKSYGDFEIQTYNVIYSDMNEIIKNIENADGILFGSPTINRDALKPILHILISLNPIIHGGKVAAAFGSYGWSGEAVKNIEARLEQLNMDLLTPGLRINFKPSEEQLNSAYKFGKNFARKVMGDSNEISQTQKTASINKWNCPVCGFIAEGNTPPETCPICHVTANKFMIDNKAFYKLSYGLYVISSISGGKKNGQIANTVFQITSDPARIAVSINKQNLTHEYIQDSKLIGVSALSIETPLEFVGKFGFKSGRTTDKFSGISFRIGESGVPIVLDNTVSWFELKVEKEIDIDTHTIFIGKVLNSELIKNIDPMTYAYYQDAKRGKSPQTSPTHTGNKNNPITDMPKYQCSVCGYIYDPAVGDPDSGIEPGTLFENVPNSWKCPTCGVSKSKFKPLA